MKSKVFFCKLATKSTAEERSIAAKNVLAAILNDNCIELEAELPIKVHFGEKGNHTYLKPAVYDGMIDLLESRQVKAFFTETSVLYGGERFNADRHAALAISHGFNRLPVIIADGAKGEESAAIPLHGTKHFKVAAIARKLAASPQVLVVSHFKGHILAGFGGALKQLSMGFASKGGKMAMHLSVTPKVKQRKCKMCKLCMTRCNAEAIEIENGKLTINPEKCVGCGACFSICPQKAISVFSLAGIKNMLFGRRFFREKLAEYALASHKDKRNIYITFAADITPGCDCEPRRMSASVPDIGVFASLDPVALDTACYDAVARKGKRFRGHEQLAYAEKTGIGTMAYEIIEL